MSQAAAPKPAEPSMEEILASIRRIISDDQPAKPAQAPPKEAAKTTAPVETRAPEPEPDPMEAVLELTQPKRRAPGPHMINDDPLPNDLDFVDPAPKPEPKGQDDIDALMTMTFDEAPAEGSETAPQGSAIPEPVPLPPPSRPADERLMSEATDRVVTTAFSGLASTILTQNARTLEDVVREMLKPMIRTWLDDNLPTMVERLVRAEIERVARGGR